MPIAYIEKCKTRKSYFDRLTRNVHKILIDKNALQENFHLNSSRNKKKIKKKLVTKLKIRIVAYKLKLERSLVSRSLNAHPKITKLDSKRNGTDNIDPFQQVNYAKGKKKIIFF